MAAGQTKGLEVMRKKQSQIGLMPEIQVVC